MSEELKKLLQQVHEGITIFDFDGKLVPCIIFEEKKYDEILSKVAGKALSINTDLNIFESLAKTSMLALSSPKSSYGKDNVFMIQLPKPEKAEDALQIIENGLKQSDGR
jgi:hypothetical protein